MNPVKSITPVELSQRLTAGERWVLLDVREPQELAIASIEGCRAIPLGELSEKHGELDPKQPIVCICHHGIRSTSAAETLRRAGFRDVYNLAGGIDRWAREVDPRIRRYR